jgi:hypothetical protein
MRGYTAFDGSVCDFTDDSEVNIIAGSAWSIAGDFEWQEDNWPLLSARDTERKSLSICAVTGNLPSDPDAWKAFSSIVSAGADAVVTKLKTTSGSAALIEMLDLPIGATIVSAEISTRGLVGTAPTLPQYRIVSWTGPTTRDNLSDVVTDAHTSGDWLMDTLATTVLANDSPEINSANRYGLFVYLPYQASSGASMEILDVKFNLSATSIRI